MVVAESLAAFSLIKGAVDGVKTLMKTTDDVKGIYKGLDALFECKEACEKEVKAKKPTSKWAKIFSKRLNDDESDELSVSSVAAMILEKKKIDHDIRMLGRQINRKYGFGTWEEILDTRDRLIEERKIRQSKLLKNKGQNAATKKANWDKVLQQLINGIIILIVTLAMFAGGYLVWVNRCTESPC